MRDVRRTGRGHGLRRGEGRTNNESSVSWTTSELSVSTPTSERLQPMTRGMTQDGGTRGGTYHGEMVRCREIQDRTAGCSSSPKRDGKDQKQRIAQSKRAGAGSLAIADHPKLNII